MPAASVPFAVAPLRRFKASASFTAFTADSPMDPARRVALGQVDEMQNRLSQWGIDKRDADGDSMAPTNDTTESETQYAMSKMFDSEGKFNVKGAEALLSTVDEAEDRMIDSG